MIDQSLLNQYVRLGGEQGYASTGATGFNSALRTGESIYGDIERTKARKFAEKQTEISNDRMNKSAALNQKYIQAKIKSLSQISPISSFLNSPSSYILAQSDPETYRNILEHAGNAENNKIGSKANNVDMFINNNVKSGKTFLNDKGKPKIKLTPTMISQMEKSNNAIQRIVGIVPKLAENSKYAAGFYGKPISKVEGFASGLLGSRNPLPLDYAKKSNKYETYLGALEPALRAANQSSAYSGGSAQSQLSELKPSLINSKEQINASLKALLPIYLKMYESQANSLSGGMSLHLDTPEEDQKDFYQNISNKIIDGKLKGSGSKGILDLIKEGEELYKKNGSGVIGRVKKDLNINKDNNISKKTDTINAVDLSSDYKDYTKNR